MDPEFEGIGDIMSEQDCEDGHYINYLKSNVSDDKEAWVRLDDDKVSPFFISEKLVEGKDVKRTAKDKEDNII